MESVTEFGELGRSRQTREQADPEQHHPRRSRTVDDKLERCFTALPPPLQKAGQRITRHAGHLDPNEHHQQMVRTRHQHHADHGTREEGIEIGSVLIVGDARQYRQRDHEHQEKQQQPADEDGERIVDCQPRKQFDGPTTLNTQFAELEQHVDERCHPAQQRDPVRRHELVETRQTSQQH